jgi:hypothetical protein
MKTRILLSSILAGLALALPVSADAHADVASSTPAEGAVAKSVKEITLNFNEAMIPATTTTQLVMTAMPGMANHNPMQIKNFTTAWSNGNKTVTLALKTALRAGTYEVRWQGAGDDGHRMNGTVHFKVG